MATTLAQLENAILQEEGTLAGTSAGIPLNNPYNLETSQGTLASYPTMEAGYEAGESYLQRAITGENQAYYPGESIGEFETTYTGGDPVAGQNLADILGVDQSTPVSTFLNGPGIGSNTSQNSSSSQPQTTLGGLIAGLATGSITPPANSPYLSKNSVLSQIESYLGSRAVDVVAVIAGLVLIAGAVFGFRSLINTTVQGVKAGAEMAG
jgi:hypothetical protein